MKLHCSGYLILEQLASGGMADIFRAAGFRGGDGPSFFSVKVLHPHLSEDKYARDMLAHEAKLLKSLHHENIIQLHDFIGENDEGCVVMDYIHGKDIRELLNAAHRQFFPVEHDVILYILFSLIEALEYVHELQSINGLALEIVHRDINPKNILLAFNGDVKIIDFGVAQSELECRQIDRRDIRGKLSYLSPEQLSDVEVDRRTDIFAIGAVFYELLSGKALFPGDTQNEIFKSLMNRDIEEAVKDLGIDELLAAILRKLLHREPLLRYQNLTETKGDLEAYMHWKKCKLSSSALQRAMRKLFPDEMENERRKTAYFRKLLESDHILKGDMISSIESVFHDENINTCGNDGKNEENVKDVQYSTNEATLVMEFIGDSQKKKLLGNCEGKNR